MSNSQIALLAIEVIIALVVMLVLTHWLLNTRQEKYKFKLYEVRDQLIYLVATNELSEDSFLFRLLYTTINRMIAEVHDVDRWSFIRAATTARTALQEAHVSRFIQEVLAASPQARQVTGVFIDTLLDIVKANSPFTKLCIRSVLLFKKGQELVKRPSFIPKEQFENYRYFGNLSHEYHLRIAA